MSYGRMLRAPQTGHEVIGELVGDLVRRRRAVRVEPARNPVDGTEDGKRQELRAAWRKCAIANAGVNHAAKATIELVAPGNHGFEVRWGECFQIEKQRGTVQFVQDRMHPAE